MAPPTPQLRPDAPARTGWFLAGYAGVAGFFVIERWARQHGTAASLDASGDDQGTTRGIVTASIAAATMAPLLRHVPLRSLPRGAAPVGLALQGKGLALRVWSMRTLGASYSRTLRTDDARGVVDDGPYRLIRHPGYAGSLLTWTGFALSSRSLSTWRSLLACLAAPIGDVSAPRKCCSGVTCPGMPTAAAARSGSFRSSGDGGPDPSRSANGPRTREPAGTSYRP